MTELRAIIRQLNMLDEISDLRAEIGGWTVEIDNQDWREKRVIAFERPLTTEPETIDDIPITVTED